MINSNMKCLSINIGDQFIVKFIGEIIDVNGGELLREKKIEKKDSDCAYARLFKEENTIILSVGIAYMAFEIKSGDTNNFFGRYEVSFLGHDGVISVLDANEEEIQ